MGTEASNLALMEILPGGARKRQGLGNRWQGAVSCPLLRRSGCFPRCSPEGSTLLRCTMILKEEHRAQVPPKAFDHGTFSSQIVTSHVWHSIAHTLRNVVYQIYEILTLDLYKNSISFYLSLEILLSKHSPRRNIHIA